MKQSDLRKPATIIDVARRAGLSKSTVSNVIRGARGITTSTRERVEQAIDDLGYRPNALARQLVQQRASIFGVVSGDLSNPFFAEIMNEIEQYAATRDYRVMFCSAPSDMRDRLAGLRALLDHRVAGLLFLTQINDDDTRNLVASSRVPAVFVTCAAEWADIVCSDDVRGGVVATNHLISLGHTRIGYLADSLSEDEADRNRQIGYVQAMQANGLKPAVFHWKDGGMTDVREMPMKRLIGGSNRYTAFFSSNDFGAIALLDHADRLGVKVPEDLSVIGFDDVSLVSLRRINLTTMAQPKATMARLAVNMLAGRIAGDIQGGQVRQTIDC